MYITSGDLYWRYAAFDCIDTSYRVCYNPSCLQALEMAMKMEFAAYEQSVKSFSFERAVSIDEI